MFDHFIRCLICLTALACPAAGGQCCGWADEVAAIQQGDDSCCCHCETESQSNHAPAEQSETCHDCFCTGALPPGFESLDLPTELASKVTLGSFDVSIVPGANRPQLTIQRTNPPSGRDLLTAYCILRL